MIGDWSSVIGLDIQIFALAQCMTIIYLFLIQQVVNFVICLSKISYKFLTLNEILKQPSICLWFIILHTIRCLLVKIIFKSFYNLDIVVVVTPCESSIFCIKGREKVAWWVFLSC